MKLVLVNHWRIEKHLCIVTIGSKTHLLWTWVNSSILFTQQLSGSGDISYCGCIDSILITRHLRTTPNDVIPEIWLCANLQNKPQKRLVEYSGIPPVHPGTPPGLPQVESSDDPSGFDVIPGETSDHIAFLSESWATNLSKHYHFRLAFTGSYYITSMINHTALKLIPICFEGKGDGIHLAFSNNHGRRKQETVGSHYLAPAPCRESWRTLRLWSCMV